MLPVAYAHGINDGGQIVGNYAGSGNATGFVDTGGVFTTVSFPGADATFPTGINNSGAIVGYYIASGATHGFVYSGGVFTTVDNPNAVTSFGGGTYIWGINDLGQMVGYYSASSSALSGFKYSGGTFTALGELPSDINNSGVIATDMGLLSGAALTTLSDPAATLSTVPNGVSNNGLVAGTYGDANFQSHGFLATPTPEPGTLTLLGGGLLGLALAARRKAPRL